MPIISAKTQSIHMNDIFYRKHLKSFPNDLELARATPPVRTVQPTSSYRDIPLKQNQIDKSKNGFTIPLQNSRARNWNCLEHPHL